MNLGDILINPLFVPLLVAVITIISNICFLYWLRKWQYKAVYITRNIEKTYIPLVAEINDRIEQLDRFLTRPKDFHYKFEKLEEIKKSELFEFVRNHDKKLYNCLEFFYDKIYPKFKELNELKKNVQESIRWSWINHIEKIAQNEITKSVANNFITDLFNSHIFVSVFTERTEEILEKWNKSRTDFINRFKVFKVAENEIYVLIKIAQPKVNELRAFYYNLKSQVSKNVTDDLIPRMRKYISSPL